MDVPVRKQSRRVTQMRWFLCLTILAVLSASTYGQDPLPDAAGTRPDAAQNEQVKGEVDRLFNSMLVKDRAWAIYLSGKYGLKENIPAILDVLQGTAGRAQEMDMLISHLGFDSLIQLDARVPAADLMPFYKLFPDAVTILLAKAPKENQEALLSLVRQIKPGEMNRQYWFAACNLLAENEARGCAAYLFGEMTIDLFIQVSDSRSGEGYGIASSAGCGFGSYRVPDDFPPVALYWLLDQAKAGAVVVAPGAHPVYYEREVVEPKNPGGVPAGRSRY